MRKLSKKDKADILQTIETLEQTKKVIQHLEEKYNLDGPSSYLSETIDQLGSVLND